jgi:hypothetical protein
MKFDCELFKLETFKNIVVKMCDSKILFLILVQLFRVWFGWHHRTQHNDTTLCVMLDVSFIMLNVIMRSVVAPFLATSYGATLD